MIGIKWLEDDDPNACRECGADTKYEHEVIIAEYNGKEVWRTCKQCWDRMAAECKLEKRLKDRKRDE